MNKVTIAVFYSLFLCILLLGNLMLSISSGSDGSEPSIKQIQINTHELLWDFNNSSAYDQDETKLDEGYAVLQKYSGKLKASKTSDFSKGKMTNLELSDDNELLLKKHSDKTVLKIITEMDKSFKIENHTSGYQTFILETNTTITNVKFFAKLDGEVGDWPLDVTLETESGTILDADYILPDELDNEPEIVDVNFNYRLEGGKTYRLGFNSESTTGSYKLMGSSFSQYENGEFVKIEYDDDSDLEETEPRSDEPENYDIDLEIFAEVFAGEGTYESIVFSADEIVAWSKLVLDGELEIKEEEIAFWFRTGSTPEVNILWSSWDGYNIIDPDDDIELKLSPSKFIQYKIVLNTNEITHSPVMLKVELHWDKFAATGYIDTHDPKLINVSSWSNFSALYELKGQQIEFYYSINSGQTWIELGVDDELNNILVNASQIRVRAVLSTNDPSVTPELDKISLIYTEMRTISDDDGQKTDPSPDDPPMIGPLPLTPVTVSSIGISAGMLAILGLGAGTETGKYAFLKYLLFLVVPLYSKVNHDKVLDHYVRKQIYKYIQTNPGTNYSEIMNDVGIKNGVLVHHLKTLEREELIKSTSDGVYYKRFYPMEMALPKKEIEGLSWFQIGIFNMIRSKPGISPKEIADGIGKSKQVINYHLRLMKSAALIRTEGKGKSTAVFVTFDEDNLMEN